MLLSYVTGTYNRLASLRANLDSVRQQMPRHLSYELVVVDGGSTDGTLEWCETQTDIHLIRHGSLKGAIKAFCDGAHEAQGEYVIMGNDDITFHPNSILRALAYLEENRDCGAVAFADNRWSKVMSDGSGYQVMQMPAIGLKGESISVNYAQVGMFRRWLGETAGWWGDADPFMSKARTYGGDNYLSARLWDLGYSVDAVEGCTIDDQIEPDALRDQNRDGGRQDSAQYYARYPRGPQVKPYPTIPNPQRERLRVLLCDIHEPGLPARLAKEYGLADALAKRGLTWQIDYINEPFDLPAAVEAWQPHLLLIQMHDTERINAGVLSAARAACPSMVVVNWNGDAHEHGLTNPDILKALKYIDLQTVINTKVMSTYAQHEIRAAYWQIGYKDPAIPYEGDVPAHDVLWQGNCYNEARKDLVKTLRSVRINKRRPNLGIYGSCPGSDGSTHYDFAYQAALNRAAKIVIGDTYPGTEGFVSNRLFQVLAAGGFLLQQYSPRLDELTGLHAGEHYIMWTNLSDLDNKIKEWIKPEKAQDRQRIAEAGKTFVRQNFSYDRQVEKLWGLLP